MCLFLYRSFYWKGSACNEKLTVFVYFLSRLWFSSEACESEEVMEDDEKPLLSSIQAGDYYSDQVDYLDPRQRRYVFKLIMLSRKC